MNLFVGMCRGQEGLPQHLRTLGYSDKWIEYEFTNAANQPVVPELIIASSQTRHTILLEFKSGANADADQLNRYAAITGNDLRQRAMLTVAECENHDITVIGANQHRERIVIGIDELGLRFPVLIATEEGLEKIRNEFRIQAVDAVFQPLLACDWQHLPTLLFPLDKDSELYEYAELSMPCVLEMIARGAPRILAREVAESIIPIWSIVSPAYQRQILQKITLVLQHASMNQFARILARNRDAARITGCQTWDVVNNPIGPGDGRAREWRRLARLQKALIDYFRNENRQQDLPLE